MRPIEFRGKAFGEFWFYGSLLIKKEINPKNKGQYIARYYITSDKLYNSEVEVRQTTIGQYTGLKDKNGKKIFEGDIIASHGYTHIIEYEEQQARFVATRFEFSIVSKDSCSLTKLWIDECDKVVVGNIHEIKE